MSDVQVESGSFRDRNGRVFYFGEEVYRTVSADALQTWRSLESQPFFRKLVETGKLVATEEVDLDRTLLDGSIADSSWAGFLQHQKIPFVSYPYEWCFSMLKDAALLHLELIRKALEADLLLKDSSSYNVQWIGSRPTFIDILSFENLRAGEPWSGYRQFCQLFLYPLLLQAYRNLPFQPWLRGSVEGIPPGQCNAAMSWRDRFRSGVFTHVYLQSKLEKGFHDGGEGVKRQIEQAGFSKDLILRNVQKLEKLVRGLHWKASSSRWGDYVQDHNYSDEDLGAKKEFVRKAAHSGTWSRAWDLGANTGVFSRILAENAGYVVAMDGDHLAVERLYCSLKGEEEQKILPLIMNLADPSPGLGWRCRERSGIEERGKPDLTLCLALVHHMVIDANVPLLEFVEWLASLESAVVIEFVSKSDPMVQGLLLNKDDQYDDYYPERFEDYLKRFFEITSKLELTSGARTLYFVHPRG